MRSHPIIISRFLSQQSGVDSMQQGKINVTISGINVVKSKQWQIRCPQGKGTKLSYHQSIFAGTAEDAKMFLKYTINRASSTGALDNIRMVLETAMVDGLVGSNQVLKTLPQKRAFLQAIHPKDCLRLLNMVSMENST